MALFRVLVLGDFFIRRLREFVLGAPQRIVPLSNGTV